MNEPEKMTLRYFLRMVKTEAERLELLDTPVENIEVLDLNRSERAYIVHLAGGFRVEVDDNGKGVSA